MNPSRLGVDYLFDSLCVLSFQCTYLSISLLQVSLLLFYFIYSSDFIFGKIFSPVPILGETGNGGLIHMRSYADHRQAIKAKPG